MRIGTSVRGGRWIGMIAIAAMIASGCVNGGGETATSPPASIEPRVAQEPTEPVTIRFSSWVGQSEPIPTFAKEFEKEHPNITIEFEDVPAGRSREKLITQVAGGNAPDVAYMDAGSVQEFASRGALVNVEPYLAGSEIVNRDDFVDAFAQLAQHDDNMYGLPFDGETTGLYYRTDLFEQAGIDAPPTTWEEFQQTAAALTDPAKKQYGFYLTAVEAAYYWYPWLWQAGGETLTPDGQHVAFDSPEGQEAADFYIGLRDYAPPDYLNTDSYTGRVSFAQGKAAMYVAGNWLSGDLHVNFPDIDDKWATAPMPEGPAGCATTFAGDTLVMFDQSENQDAAWLWMEFLSRPENVAQWTFKNEGSSLLPPRESLLTSDDFQSDPALRGFADAMACAVTSDVEQPKWPQVEEELNERLGEAIYGDISADQALREAAEEGERILSD
jgi:multiple sugar transport system substrate-binding protein